MGPTALVLIITAPVVPHCLGDGVSGVSISACALNL